MKEQYEKIITELKERLERSNFIMESSAYNDCSMKLEHLPPGAIESTHCSTQLLIEVRDNKALLERINNEKRN